MNKFKYNVVMWGLSGSKVSEHLMPSQPGETQALDVSVDHTGSFDDRTGHARRRERRPSFSRGLNATFRDTRDTKIRIKMLNRFI
jgi:hypothetical protein